MNTEKKLSVQHNDNTKLFIKKNNLFSNVKNHITQHYCNCPTPTFQSCAEQIFFKASRAVPTIPLLKTNENIPVLQGSFYWNVTRFMFKIFRIPSTVGRKHRHKSRSIKALRILNSWFHDCNSDNIAKYLIESHATLFFHSGTGGSSHKTQTVVLFQKTKNNIKLAQLERDCWSGTTSRTSRYS